MAITGLNSYNAECAQDPRPFPLQHNTELSAFPLVFHPLTGHVILGKSLPPYKLEEGYLGSEGVSRLGIQARLLSTSFLCSLLGSL